MKLKRLWPLLLVALGVVLVLHALSIVPIAGQHPAFILSCTLSALSAPIALMGILLSVIGVVLNRSN